MPPVNFDAMQAISAVAEAPNANVHDTTLRANDGAYYGRVSLMADMLQEVVEKRWIPSGANAIRDNVKLVPETFTFNLSDWTADVDAIMSEIECNLDDNGYNTEAEAQYYKARMEELKPVQCGFSACAVGHACYDSRFNDAGLLMTEEGAPQVLGLAGESDWTAPSSWSAVNKFFGVSSEIAEWLFMEDQYPLDQRNNPAAVRDRCLELVERGVAAIESDLGL